MSLPVTPVTGVCPSSSSSLLVRRVYRALLRSSRHHDRQPQLKARIIHPMMEKRNTQEGIKKIIEMKRQEMEEAETQQHQHHPTHTSHPHPHLPHPPLPHESIGSIYERTIQIQIAFRKATERYWRQHTSLTSQRVFDSVFRGACFYWPHVDFESLARNEFRRTIEEEKHTPTTTTMMTTTNTHEEKGKGKERTSGKRKHTAVESKEGPAATATSHQSTAAAVSTPAPAVVSSHLTDAFTILRLLNKNISGATADCGDVSIHLARHLHSDATREGLTPLSLTGVESEPVWRTANGPPPMTPAADKQIRQGRFLLAHPQMSSPWHQAIILILRHDDQGTVGVLINSPRPTHTLTFDTRPTAGSKWSSTGSGDANLSPVLMRSGGPVQTPSPDERTSQVYLLGQSKNPRTAGGSEFAPRAAILLHRIPALAPVSRCVMGGPNPVWIINTRSGFVSSVAIRVKLNQAQADLKQQAHSVASVDSSVSFSSLPPPSPTVSMLAFRGMCIWSRGQIESELADGSWMMMDGDGQHVFIDTEEEVRRRSETIAVEDPHAHEAGRLSMRLSDEDMRIANELTESHIAGHQAAVAAAAVTSASAPTPTASPVDAAGGGRMSMPLLWRRVMDEMGGEYRAWASIDHEEEEEEEADDD